MKRGKTIVTYFVIALCVGIFLLINTFPHGTSAANAIILGAFYKPFILAGEYWRLLTVGFVHVDLWHLAMNMMAMYSLGRLFEQLLGVKKYLTVLIASIIGASLFVLASGRNNLVVGLSGGLYGLLAAYMILLFRSGGWKLPPVRAGLVNMIFINVLLNFLPGISVYGHIGGFVTGLIVYGCITVSEQNRHLRIHYIVSLMILLLFTSVISYRNRYIPKTSRYLKTDMEVLFFDKKYLSEKYALHMARRLEQVYHINNGMLEDLLAGED